MSTQKKDVLSALAARWLPGVQVAGFALMLGWGTCVLAAELVARISHDEVLASLASPGKPIIFVDARERDEWAEERLPGALQLPLRQARAGVPPSLPKDATLVVYCIKDFRGFEVARALQSAGYKVRTLVDPGLQGWKRAKLPTAGDLPNQDDERAVNALKARAGSAPSTPRGVGS